MGTLHLGITFKHFVSSQSSVRKRNIKRNTEGGERRWGVNYLIIRCKDSTFFHSLAPTCACQEKANQLPFAGAPTEEVTPEIEDWVQVAEDRGRNCGLGLP